MSEENIIAKTKRPNTIESLKKDFRNLGLEKGMNILVHASLSAIGWVSGREQAVIEALKAVITEEGTIMMPAHSADLSDPKDWGNPPVPEDWWQIIRDTMPAYDEKLTSCRSMGRIADLFRTMDGVLRSNHPQVSCSAWGKYASFLTENHNLAFSTGVNSPIGKLYELDGHVLLLGVTHHNNTSLHLAEHKSQTRAVEDFGAPVMENGQRVWKMFKDDVWEDEAFEVVGKAFEASHEVIIGNIGNAESRLMKQRELVDFATSWFREEGKN